MTEEQLEDFFWDTHVKQGTVGFYANDLDSSSLFKNNSPLRLSRLNTLLDHVIDFQEVKYYCKLIHNQTKI
jgi:hypothetical protein